MSKDWIERGTELGDAIGDHNLANDIIDAGYTSVLATHGPNGNVVYKLVDSAGNIGSVWTP